MKAPVEYIPKFVSDPEDAFKELLSLEWERRDTTPRSEYYCNDFPNPYVYGRGAGQREYLPRPYHNRILQIRERLEEHTGAKLDVCFLNRYHDQSDHLGWHADDSPEMDDARPIVTVSLGVAREIWFRPVLTPTCSMCGEPKGEPPNPPEHWHKMSCSAGSKRVFGADPDMLAGRRIWKDRFGEVEKLLLESGSAAIMAPGMQDAWQHRIPRASFNCGERISLTFRGYVSP